MEWGRLRRPGPSRVLPPRATQASLRDWRRLNPLHAGMHKKPTSASLCGRLAWGLHRLPHTATFVDLLYGFSGSINTFTHAGKPDAKALSSAGRISSGLSTNSPYPPSASTILS